MDNIEAVVSDTEKLWRSSIIKMQFITIECIGKRKDDLKSSLFYFSNNLISYFITPSISSVTQFRIL